MDIFRRLVAGTRRRYENEGYSLDLTYIIPDRIIAMSYPSNGFEGLYRNPIEKVSLRNQDLYLCVRSQLDAKNQICN